MNLSNLSPHPGSRKQRKRLGRGPGSGLGKTSGRGHKGFKARSGSGIKPGFEGGQMPLQRRLPKRGFRNPFRKQYAVVNLRDLNEFEPGSVVDRAALQATGLISAKEQLIKVLGDGELTVALTVNVDKVSESARGKIEAAGGTVSAEAQE
ncbi:MAG TPA: 50S ribosomal protein L15 [Desulfurivibrio alkaliphilus]|uniref:Large ribosomal subunit protein uL15 n=1 Tax=Desulfurivibrio alkaliphilus TaxID=427923 RepID=A0A7C2THX2_9BACT|nr:50S ribosomal protein L15 [Desulfurivibrio alkaliphilus]